MSEIVNTEHFDELVALYVGTVKGVSEYVNFRRNELYFEYGKRISGYLEAGDWGDSTVVGFSRYAKSILGEGVRGLSPASLWRAVQFYRTYWTSEFLAEVLQEITWTNNTLILPLKSKEEREFYILKVKEYNLSSTKLNDLIENDFYNLSILSPEQGKLILTQLSNKKNALLPALHHASESGLFSLEEDWDRAQSVKTLIDSENTRLCRIFIFFNSLLFNDELEIPVFRIFKDATRGHRGGSFAPNYWKEAGSERVTSEIALDPDSLDLPIHELAEIMLHQMIHHRNRQKGLVDIDREKYHNETFRKQAEAHGLMCEYTDKFGWGTTKLDGKTMESVTNALDCGLPCLKRNRKKAGSSSTASKKSLSTCPICNFSIPNKTEHPLICSVCKADMETQKV